MIEAITFIGTVVNCGMLLKIVFMLGQHTVKHEDHERRINNLERKKYA